MLSRLMFVYQFVSILYAFGSQVRHQNRIKILQKSVQNAIRHWISNITFHIFILSPFWYQFWYQKPDKFLSMNNFYQKRTNRIVRISNLSANWSRLHKLYIDRETIFPHKASMHPDSVFLCCVWLLRYFLCFWHEQLIMFSKNLNEKIM